MRVVTQFPERFKLVNEQVAELVLWYPLSENEAETPRKVVSDGVTYEYGGYYDFYVTMKDGRCLGFWRVYA